MALCFLLGSIQILPAEPLELRDEVVVETPPLTVSKVIKGSVDPALGSVTLGPVPAPGETRYISQTYVKMKAASQGQQVPEVDGEVVRATVTRAQQILTRSDLKPLVLEIVRNRRALGEYGSISVSGLPKKLAIAPGEFSLRMRRANLYRNHRGMHDYRFSVIQNGEAITSFSASLTISIDRRVAVTVSRLGRGEEISASNIEWKQRDIGRLRGIPITRDRNLQQYVTTRSLQPGQIVLDSHLKRPVVIERRERVTIRYQRNGVVITTTGEAMEDGAIGDQIMVENLSSEEKVSAEVKKNGLVEVHS
jgi:flagella basal body P-ring formation protein FlgA